MKVFMSVESQIFNVLKESKRNTIFFPEDFLEIASPEAIRKALQRLVDKEKILRVAHGIYVLPDYSETLGQLRPSATEVALAIARRAKIRLIPTGTYALNALGLSTQVPLKIVFLTDGAPRVIKIGKQTIRFKKTTPKNLSLKGEKSGLAIQALKEIGEKHVSSDEKDMIVKILKSEDSDHLRHDIKLAPVWIARIMKKAL